MLRLLIVSTGWLVAVVLLLAVAPTAHAHNSSGWYWSEARAERALYLYEEDVYDANCVGFGHRYKRLYKHFACDTYDIDDEYYGAGTVHVIGAGFSRYRFYWDDE